MTSSAAGGVGEKHAGCGERRCAAVARLDRDGPSGPGFVLLAGAGHLQPIAVETAWAESNRGGKAQGRSSGEPAPIAAACGPSLRGACCCYRQAHHQSLSVAVGIDTAEASSTLKAGTVAADTRRWSSSKSGRSREDTLPGRSRCAL